MDANITGPPFACKTFIGDGIHFFGGGNNYRVLFRPEDHCLGLVCRGWEEVAE